MKKKLLIVLMVLMPLSGSATERIKYLNVHYELNGNEAKVEKVDWFNMYTIAFVKRPEVHIWSSITWNGKRYKVTEIGSFAFKHCSEMVAVYLPPTIRKIGSHVFENCPQLQTINIQSKNVEIEKGAFMDCKALTSFTIPDGVKTIKKNTFSDCKSLTYIFIPNSVTEIEEGAFGWCKALTSITIPSSVKVIRKDAFRHCDNLASVTIMNGDTEIEDGAIPSKAEIKGTYRPLMAQQAMPGQTDAPAPSQSIKPQTTQAQPSRSNSVMSSSTQKQTVSAVDKNIFVNNDTDRNTFAVIIGNEQYKNEANVPFAENDAKVFKEYVQKTLGVPEKQIRYMANAGLNDLRMAVRWLKQAMEVSGGQGKAIFYYAGHGIPDEANKTAYLLPTDGIGSDVESGYSLQRLFSEFSKMPAQRTTVFLDACFSGSKREGGMMASARGVAIKVKPMTPQGKVVVFTAAQSDETAYPFKSQQHGMFTYYLLKKLQDTKGNVTLGELSDYLTTEVKRESFVENNRIQTPTVKASTALAGSWRTMKLK